MQYDSFRQAKFTVCGIGTMFLFNEIVNSIGREFSHAKKTSRRFLEIDAGRGVYSDPGVGILHIKECRVTFVDVRIHTANLCEINAKVL